MAAIVKTKRYNGWVLGEPRQSDKTMVAIKCAINTVSLWQHTPHYIRPLLRFKIGIGVAPTYSTFSKASH